MTFAELNIKAWIEADSKISGANNEERKKDFTSGWQFLIGGILLVIIPQALTIWGEAGLLNLKDLLARI